MQDEVKKATPATESFSRFIAQLDHGRTEETLNEQLSQLIRAVQDLGKPGSLNLKLTVQMDGSLVAVLPKAEVKIPQPGIRATLFHADPKKPGEVYVDDPRQLALNLTKLPPQQWAGRNPEEE